MKTIKITKADLDADNYYKEEGIAFEGPDFDGSVEIEENLGIVRFKKGIYVTGWVIAKAGTGITAGWGINAGEGIKAGSGIEAGHGIEAGWGIKAGEGIEAGHGIKAGWGIKAGEGIEAGHGIEAGEGIEAAWGIVSHYSWVKAKHAITINSKCAIAAGIFSTNGPQEVEAQEINGKVAWGNVKLLPKPEPTTDAGVDEITLNGVKYRKVV